MTFLGKWSWQSDSGSVQIDRATGKLVIAAKSEDGSDRFNAYGTATSFTLQASNGKYLAQSGTTYVADKAPDEPVSRFTLVSTRDQPTYVVDLGLNGKSPERRLWNRDGTTITSIVQATPPPTTAAFTWTEVSPGIEAILQSGFTSQQPDLSWVDLTDTDFAASPAVTDFTEANLSNANLARTKYSPGTPFQHAVAHKVNFSGAVLVDCQFDYATLTSATFVDAKMSRVDLNHADLTGAILNGADLTDTANLDGTTFEKAKLIGAKFIGTRNVIRTNFAGADLSGVDFTGSSVTGTMDLRQANLTGATLSNPPDGRVTVFPGFLVFDAETNFRRAKIQYLDLTGYDLREINFAHADLTGCVLDRVKLDRANLGYATMTDAKLTGGVSMHGTNLANASMQGADLTGAQLGAISLLFRVGEHEPDYADLLSGLAKGQAATVANVFAKNKRPLTGAVVVRALGFGQGSAWQVQDASATYSVYLEETAAVKSLNVYRPTTAAVLSNAFMVDVNFKGANLFGVRASGAHLYATAGRSVNLNQAKINSLQANNANLGGIDLSQANLAGSNFDYSVLTGANLTGATLGADSDGGQSSFNGANLQGADFSKASLNDSIFANAAVAVADPVDPGKAAGVRLFSLGPSDASLIGAELDTASPNPDAGPNDPKRTFTIPIGLLSKMSATGPVPKGLARAFEDAKVSLADSAMLVVLSTELYWQVTDESGVYTVFPSVNQDYQPALGVASGPDYTINAAFYMPLSNKAYLRNGPVAKPVVDAFAAAHHPLGPTAKVTTRQHPVEWQVINGEDVYTLWMFYDSSAVGVASVITVRVSIPNAISIFAGSSIALSSRSVLRRIDDRGWTIDNDSGNPFNSAVGYIQFKALKTATGGIDVYGSVIRMVRASGNGSQEYTNVRCDATKLAGLADAVNSICPNGATVAANQADGLAFPQWLTADYLPRPPRCIPDPSGKFFCPM